VVVVLRGTIHTTYRQPCNPDTEESHQSESNRLLIDELEKSMRSAGGGGDSCSSSSSSSSGNGNGSGHGSHGHGGGPGGVDFNRGDDWCWTVVEAKVSGGDSVLVLMWRYHVWW